MHRNISTILIDAASASANARGLTDAALDLPPDTAWR